MGDRPRIDIIHMRDPDSECGLEIWFNGERVGAVYNRETREWENTGPDVEIDFHSFDPGAGYTKHDIEEMRRDYINAAPEFLKGRISEIWDSFAPSYRKWGLD